MPGLLLATFFFSVYDTLTATFQKLHLTRSPENDKVVAREGSGFVVRDCKHGRERREPGYIDAVFSLVSMVTYRTFLRIEFLLTS